MPTWAAIVLGFIGSAGFWSWIQFMILRKDDRKGLKKQLKKIEKDSCRTQMLLLMFVRPQDLHELMIVAEHYFKDLHGNWYMTSLFRAFLKEKGIAFPEWVPEISNSNNKE